MYQSHRVSVDLSSDMMNNNCNSLIIQIRIFTTTRQAFIFSVQTNRDEINNDNNHKRFHFEDNRY